MAGASSIVKNPLTIIAMFAGIAEVSGTAVLPLIAELNQRLYIYFLMLFPTFLVSLFFLTLFKKPESLYAPSDFADEKNYMAIISQQGISISPSILSIDASEVDGFKEVEKSNVTEDTAIISGCDIESEVTKITGNENTNVKDEILCEPHAEYATDQNAKKESSNSKSLIIKRLGSEVSYMALRYVEDKLNIRFDLIKTEMKNDLGYHNFDGVYYPPVYNLKFTGDIIFLDINLVDALSYQRLAKKLDFINESWNHLKNIRVFFVLVVDGHSKQSKSYLNKQIELIHKSAKFPVEIIDVTIDELTFNYGHY